MPDPRKRDDISPFIVHLTRNYPNRGLNNAQTNLINILKKRTIHARHPHCLYKPVIENSEFTTTLKKKFNTVCLTETPLHQISKLVARIPGRAINLKPYGIVFWRENLIEEGASPAIYINAKGTNLKKYLLENFRETFNGIESYHKLRAEEKEYYDEIIQYYSLINIIDSHYDFAWEREWRYPGTLKFQFDEIVAIIAGQPDLFVKECKNTLSKSTMTAINRTPIIKPDWSYEDIIDEMSHVLWRVKA